MTKAATSTPSVKKDEDTTVTPAAKPASKPVSKIGSENTLPADVPKADTTPATPPGSFAPKMDTLTSKLSEDSAVGQNVNKAKEVIINFIVPIVSLSLSAFVYLVFLKPSYTELPLAKIALEEQTTLESTLRSKISNLKRLIDFKSIVSENSDLINKVLVSEQAVPSLLTQIDQITRNSGLKVSRLNYSLGSDEEDATGPELVLVNLSAEGNFSQLMTFLKDLENAARIISVDSVRYAIDESDEGAVLSANFVLSSPYLFVESSAVTDTPVDLDISNPEFISLINRIKTMRFYDSSFIDEGVPVVEIEEGSEDGEDTEEVDDTEVTDEEIAEIIEASEDN